MEKSRRREVVFDKVERSIHRMLAFTGMDLLKYKTFFHLYRFRFNIAQATTFCVLEAYSLYLLRNDMFVIIFSLCVLGLGVQGCTIMWKFTFENDPIRDRFLQVKASVAHQSEDSEEEKIKDWYVDVMKKICDIYFYVYMTLIILNVTYPVFGRVFLEERVLLFGFDAPLLDEKVSPDYEIVLCYQYIQDVYTCANILSYQYFFIIMMLHNWCLMDVLVKKMERPLILHSPQNYQRLLDIILRHKEQMEFFEEIKDIFNDYFTIQLICTVGQASLMVYVFLFWNWYPGYFLLILSMGMLLVNCIYGATTEAKGDQLANAVFHTLDWTVLEPKQRRAVLLVLRTIQNNNRLTCGRIFVLNYHTFLNVLNAIYAMFTMMRQVTAS